MADSEENIDVTEMFADDNNNARVTRGRGKRARTSSGKAINSHILLLPLSYADTASEGTPVAGPSTRPLPSRTRQAATTSEQNLAGRFPDWVHADDYTGEQLNEMDTLGIPRDLLYDYLAGCLTDGPVVVTAAAGLDSKLPIQKRLVVPTNAGVFTAHGLALTSACLTWQAFKTIEGYSAGPVILAAYSVVSCGLATLRQVGDVAIKDGDWRYSSDPISPDVAETVRKSLPIKQEEFVTMISMIYATKANWWNTNHHTTTGNNALPPILQRLAGKLEEMLHTPFTKDMIHTFGHWASTLAALSRAGKKVLDTRPVGLYNHDTIHSEDIRIRTSTLPAGAHKLAFCYQVFVLMMSSTMRQFMSPAMIETVLSAGEKYHLIKKDDTRYHVGSAYLTGEERIIYDDNMSPGGMAICFVQHVLPASSLAKSPYFVQNKEGGYKTLVGYSSEFEALVIGFEHSFAGPKMKRLISSKVTEVMHQRIGVQRHSSFASSVSDILSRASAVGSEEFLKLAADLRAKIQEESKTAAEQPAGEPILIQNIATTSHLIRAYSFTHLNNN